MNCGSTYVTAATIVGQHQELQKKVWKLFDEDTINGNPQTPAQRKAVKEWQSDWVKKTENAMK